jgi:hypothetical protein
MARHRWVLQADIRLYFPSIDLTILKAQLAAVISCPGTLWLLDQIFANGATMGPALDAFPGDTLLTPLELARERLERELALLRLRAHPIKTQLRRCRDGASFVGFVVRPSGVRVRNHNLRRGRQRLRLQRKAVAAGLLPVAAARASLLSWNAHLAHGHTWRLRRRLFAGLSYGADLP